MPKALVLGNGSVLICLDQWGQLRDLYYHYVGMENHVGFGCVHRLGILIDGQFSWLQNPEWEISLDYAGHTLSSDFTAKNKTQELELKFCDVVYNEKDIFLRQVKIINHSIRSRQIKLFFHQQFKINETRNKDTAYYDPEEGLIVHYEGRRVFAVTAYSKGICFDDYSIGNYGIDGKEGTWKDAEDGRLEKCSIEHGRVDSVIGLDLKLEAKESSKVDYWITIGRSFEEAIELNQYVKSKTPGHLLETTKNFWQAWAWKKDQKFGDLGGDLIDFYKKSLLILRTHTGNSGDIIASGDSDMYQYGKDTYAYVWPRDAAFIVMALDQAGYSNLTRPFFEFANEAISKDGYFYHKYLCDRSVGSSWHPWVFNGKKRLAIQEDEIALVIYGLWKHYQATLDLEFIEKIYNSLIKKAADFMCGYRDEETGMPKGSYDLWERIFAVSTFTSASVCGGLDAAAGFAEILGKKDERRGYQKVAEKIRQGIIKYLYNPENNYFYRSFSFENGKINHDETIDISSFYGVFLFNILKKDDPRLKKAFQVLKKRLYGLTPVGGAIRFENDDFHRVNENAAPNPWFIATFWMAHYEAETAKSRKELKAIKEKFYWAKNLAAASGILSEQVRSDNGGQVSASPLAWSHAELIRLILNYSALYKKLK